MCITYDRGALGHTVTDGVREAYLMEEVVHLLVESGTAYDYLLEVAAEGLADLVLDLLEHNLVKHRKLEQEPYGTALLDYRLDGVLVNLLDDERNGYDYVRAHFLHGLEYDLRARNPGEEIYVHTSGELVEHLEHKSVHVSCRQHGNNLAARLELRNGIPGENDIGPESPVRNHYTL